MANKWADYLISATRYNAAETHIEKVKVHPDNGDKVGTSSEWTAKGSHRQPGIRLHLRDDLSADGSWNKGAEVRVITVDGEKFIRTDADRIKEDNLEDLPRF